ncbi:MAG TPA: response regulator [Gemmataceae bacterium]|jgi:carbon storage regulator CsrA|nr:response regulator [Gemmataceae bacterium]
MLVLSRKLHEKIVLPTLKVAVQVVGIKGGAVRLGIQAPREVTVLREEIPDRAAEWAEQEAPLAAPAAREPKPIKFWQPLYERLKSAGVRLGLLRLQLDTGLTEEARQTLAGIQEDFQLLCYGVEGEMDGSATAAPMKLQKALLVEDNRNERELLAGFLRQSGLEVDTAGDGSDALAYLGSHAQPDVILLDMGLPHVDGPTMVRQLRSNPVYAGLKIFGVSGHLPEEFDLEWGPRGIDRWFQKPLDPAALVHGLAEELCSSRN